MRSAKFTAAEKLGAGRLSIRCFAPISPSPSLVLGRAAWWAAGVSAAFTRSTNARAARAWCLRERRGCPSARPFFRTIRRRPPPSAHRAGPRNQEPFVFLSRRDATGRWSSLAWYANVSSCSDSEVIGGGGYLSARLQTKTATRQIDAESKRHAEAPRDQRVKPHGSNGIGLATAGSVERLDPDQTEPLIGLSICVVTRSMRCVARLRTPARAANAHDNRARAGSSQRLRRE